MTISDAGADASPTPPSGHDADDTLNRGHSTPPLSAGPTMRFGASADEDRPAGRRPPKRDRIIDARALSVVTQAPDVGARRRRHDAVPLRRYAPAGALAAAALGLAFLGGSLLGSNRSGSAAAGDTRAQVAHNVPPPETVPLRDLETSRQMAQMAVDVRLLSARMETLRAAVESRQPGDGERALKRSVDALRSGLEQSKLETSKAFGQMTQKLDRLQTQHDPNAPKLAAIAERLDRIERRANAASDVTGSILKPVATSSSPTATPKPSQAVSRLAELARNGELPRPAEIRASLDAPKPAKAAPVLPGPRIIMPAALSESKPQPNVIAGYVLRDMEGDVAIVEGHGQILELARGDSVPGLGRVEGLERRGREWVVVTSRGLITAHLRN